MDSLTTYTQTNQYMSPRPVKKIYVNMTKEIDSNIIKDYFSMNKYTCNTELQTITE
jgi:hypothetical protein